MDPSACARLARGRLGVCLIARDGAPALRPPPPLPAPMEPLRTLLLARTHTVVLDPELVESASTRPARDTDVDRFEGELVELGFAMSLDLAMTVRRLPHQAIQELRAWVVDTLARATGRPRAPRAPTGGVHARYLERVLDALAAAPAHPCPWCARVTEVGALDPCGPVVSPTRSRGGAHGGRPICRRRVAPGEPFLALPAAPVGGDGRALGLVHLAFDLAGLARARFEALLARTAPLSPAERAELEAVIDAVGPGATTWLPAHVPVRATMAIAVARLWLVAPDRAAMVRRTAAHVRTATDALRVATVLMGGAPNLGELGAPARLRSVERGLRRAVLAALEQLPTAEVVVDMRRHRARWKRAGEHLHPFEWAGELPRVAVAFAALRGTALAGASFGAAARERAADVPGLARAGDRLRVRPWRAAAELALRAGDVRAALAARGAPRRAAPPRRSPAARGARGRRGPARGRARRHARRDPRGPRAAPRAAARARVAGRRRRAPTAAGAGAAVAAVAALARAELVARASIRRGFARAVIDRALAARLWQLACVHAAARANVLYVRDPDDVQVYRRRDGEPALARLDRLAAGVPDERIAAVPRADAPTWVALARCGELAIPAGSAGFLAEPPPRGLTDVTWHDHAALVAELAPRS